MSSPEEKKVFCYKSLAVSSNYDSGGLSRLIHGEEGRTQVRHSHGRVAAVWWMHETRKNLCRHHVSVHVGHIVGGARKINGDGKAASRKARGSDVSVKHAVPSLSAKKGEISASFALRISPLCCAAGILILEYNSWIPQRHVQTATSACMAADIRHGTRTYSE
jgi:hypothetical protein